MEDFQGKSEGPFEAHERAGEFLRKRVRPTAVTVIATYEFFTGALMLLLLLGTWLDPTGHFSGSLDFEILTYVVTQHNVSTYSSSPIMPLIAAFVVSTGLGLWFLKKWARNILIVVTAMTTVLWLRRFVVDWALGETTLKTQSGRESVYAVVIINALIFYFLAFDPDVKQAFGDMNDGSEP